jgi:hypothetical protein
LSCSKTESSFCSKAQDIYDKLEYIDGKGLPCSLFTGDPSGEFQVNNSRWVKKQFKHYPDFWPVLSWFRLSQWWWQFPGGQLSLELQVDKCPIFVSTIDQVTASAHVIVALVLHHDTWNTALDNTRHVQVIR